MKMKRMVACVLALLLVVSLLPMAAMAEPNTHERIEEEETYDYNEATNVTNYGTVTNNYADPRTSPAPSITPSIKDNNGTVVYNGGSSDSDKGTVVNNNSGGTVVNNKPTGTVEYNYGLVTNNTGTVNNNESGGTVEINGGKIKTNNGTVGKKEDGQVVAGSGNNNAIVANCGTVISNNENGTVGTNTADGKIEINDGKIQTNNGTVGKKEDGQVVAGSGNNNAIDANCGTVISNNEYGTVGTNTADGKIEINDGTVGIYNDDIKPVPNTGNYGTIGINNGTVTFNQNGATIGINNKSVAFNQNGATIGTNNGKVASNYGTVETNAIDGVVNNYNPGEIAARSLDNGDAAAPEEKPNVDGVGTNFGTVVDKTSDTEKTYYGLSWGDSVEKLNSIESFVVSGDERNLDEIANGIKRDGYKMTGYTAYSRKDGENTAITETKNYSMKAPTWLQILWKKIVKPASDEPEVKTVQNNIPTSLSADQVKVGAYVRRGNLLFRIIEVTDNDIRVATVGKLSEEDLADMLGFLKQHLSDAQIAKINGEPALLEQELVTYFFGDSYEHIAFRAARDLFA